MAASVFQTSRWGFRFAVAVCAIANLSLVFRPSMFLFDRPLDEDGFYCFTIARNIARGLGISADGEILTNGFQPLWVFFLSPVFHLVDGDRSLGVRLIFLINANIHIVAGLLLGRFAVRVFPVLESEKTVLFWLVASLYCGSATTWLHSFNGMETGLLLLTYCGILLATTYLREGNKISEAILGVLLGVLGLVRIDAGIFVALLLLALLATDRRVYADRLASIFLIGGIAGLITSPWLAWNVLQFGNPMPISGQALYEFAIDWQRLEQIGKAVVGNLSPALYLSSFENGATIGIRCVAIIGMALAAMTFARTRPATSSQNKGLTAVIVLLVACAILAFWYNFYSRASFFYFRYLAPLSLIGVLLAALAFLLILRFLSHRSSARLLAYAGLGVCLPTVLFTAIAHTGVIFQGHSMLRHQVPLVLQHVPERDWVASTQSGTLGFMRDRVLNLDGKVNPEALARKNELPAYLAEKGVNWFADWPDFAVNVFGPNPERIGWHKVEVNASMALYRYQKSDYPVGADSHNTQD